MRNLVLLIDPADLTADERAMLKTQYGGGLERFHMFVRSRRPPDAWGGYPFTLCAWSWAYIGYDAAGFHYYGLRG